MKCPNCQRENEPTSHFCIFCGAPFQEPEAERLSEPVQSSADTSQQQMQALQEEVCRLRELITLMNDRLAAMEKLQGIAVPPPQPLAVPPVTEVPKAVPTIEPTFWGVARTLEARIPKAVPSPAQKIAPAAPIPSAPPRKVVPRKPREWEWILGGNWLVRVGVLALVIGVGFFLKFAFDQNWLGPTARVILGTVGGLAMLGGGHFWQKRYPTFAQALSGGGIALLYLSIFAAYAIFSLVNFYLSVGLLLLVSVGSATLALRYNSMALAVIGIFGAFSAPFILAGFEAGTPVVAQAGRSSWLLVYIMVVDLGVLALSTFRNWHWFTLLALLSSLAAFGAWYGRFGDEASLLTSQGSLTLIFLIFVGATTLYHIVWRRPSQYLDYTLMIINAASYFGISYGLLRADFREWMGGFTILLALFYGSLAYVALKRSTEVGLFALGIALIFLTMAIPIQLGDKAWTTIAWAAEGAVLVWLSFVLRMPQFRSFSYAVFAAMAVRLLFLDTRMYLPAVQPFLNERFLAFLVSITATCSAGYLIWRGRKSLLEWEKNAWSVYPIFLVAASLFVTVAMPIELGDRVWTTIAWAAEGAVLVWLSFILRMPQFRNFSYAVFAAMAVRLLFFDTKVDLRTFQPFINERFLAFVVSIAALYFAGWRERKALWKKELTWSYYPLFLLAANFFSLWLLSAEVINYFDSRLTTLTVDQYIGPAGSALENAKNLSLTALWASYATIALVIGIVIRSRLVRLSALTLLAVPIIKVFAYDVFALEQVYRIIAFVGLGVLLVVSGYLYHRYSGVIKEFLVKK